MKIEVTQTHIDWAKILLPRPGNLRTHSCPVALAVAEVIPHRGVSARFVDLTGVKDMIRLPAEATEAINNFDNSGLMEPFEFELDVPQEVTK